MENNESAQVDGEPSKEIAVIVAESGVDQTKAQTVLASFATFFEQASEWERKTKGLSITDVSQTKEMKLAREGRLQLKEVRVAAKKTHDKLKESALVEGRFIDSIYNLIEGVTKPLEITLLEKEQFVERQEAARVEALRSSRAEKLAVYQVDTSFYDLGNMPETSFNQLLENSQIAAETRIKAQRQAEEDRIAAEKAEQEERARVSAENARLKADAEAREAEITAEREKAEKERKAREAEDAKERARIEAERVAKADAERRAAQAGDAEKVLAYVTVLESVNAPSVSSEQAKAIIDGCATLFARARAAADKLA
jgi:hypothetical protein